VIDAVQVGAAHVTINRNYHVLIAQPDGRVKRGSDGGFYARDTRFVSSYELTVAGKRPQLLNACTVRFFSARHVMTNPRLVTPDLELDAGSLALTLARTIQEGVHEDYDVVNHARRAVRFELAIAMDFDFADMFDVRSIGRQRDRKQASRSSVWSDEKRQLVATYTHGPFSRELHIVCERSDSQPVWREGQIVFDLELAPKQRWHTCVRWLPVTQPGVVGTTLDCLALEQSEDVEPALGSHVSLATVNGSVQLAWDRAVMDMESLRLVDPNHPDDVVPAAGTPWFLTLFGRDSLVTSMQTVLGSPELARGTLARLSALQATRDDPERDMEPGKILHEIRYGEIAELGILPFQPYYGTHDATSLFVIELAHVYEWTADRDLLIRYLPAAEAAMAWIDRYGDRDGDGFQEYATRSSKGFYNQSWKDAHDAIPDEHGAQAPLPLALCELQGYAYDAKLRLAQIYEALGREEDATRLRTEAYQLFERFNDAFWWESEGTYFLGLDGDKHPIRTVASNPGHCLMSGIVPRERARRVAFRLLAEDMWSGWGIRTLSADHPAYNPFSYHTGSIWPHDNATIASGFTRYGLRAETARIALAMFDAANAFAAHRLPELFSGLPRTHDDFPVQYLGANVPQAWAASAIFRLVTIMCGIHARREAGRSRIYLDPALPDWLPELTLRHIRAGTGLLSVHFGPNEVEVLHNTTGFEAISGPPPARSGQVEEALAS
jgi:glycogen debranching enzyme